MRLVLASAAFAAIFALSSAKAEPVYIPGGPAQQGNLCQVTTSLSGSDEMSGFLTPCAPKAAKKKS